MEVLIANHGDIDEGVNYQEGNGWAWKCCRRGLNMLRMNI